MEHNRTIQLLAAGDRSALQTLYEHYGPRLFMFGLRLTAGNEPEAEDLVQDCFVRIWSKRRTLRAVESVRGYLFKSLRNIFLNQQRKTGRERQRGRDYTATLTLVTEGARSCPITADELNEALSALPEEQKEAAILRVWGEMTFAEMGQTLGISENTAASRYRYALGKLRYQLGDLR